ANRGEIACRVIAACRGLGIDAVAIYSDADAKARHVRMADAAHHVGPSRVDRSYLNVEAVLAAAREAGADAVHPGYGLLSENADFAAAVMAAGLTWIGPKPETIAAMGDKGRARAMAAEAGVPVLPGSPRFAEIDAETLAAHGAETGFPLLVKAAGGGGGIGMRRVDRAEDLAGVVEATRAMAERAFGNPTVYLERFVPTARHIEVQVFGFGDGRAVHLYERECSVQRRFQKVIEEGPSPALDAATRTRMAESAAALAARQNYAGAGTVEFIFDDDSGAFFFLEMNTRIQVEHAVTEMITGLDLVQMQLRLARGDDFSGFTQSDVAREGHAIELRLYAENPAKNYLPSPGQLSRVAFPGGDGVRVDTGFEEGDELTPFYDPLIAKLIVRGADRDDAMARGRAMLRETVVEGPATNLALLRAVLDHAAFIDGRTFTNFLDVHRQELLASV
ncbi:MAG: acetyl-CoA carboxylase biotin carboxylase subunit, partial [Rhizobiales bacterium]|nr:acetyl-CoA carboxylase biotin carboxylase subunit [Hyphomicrobiales bacterium]